MALSALQISRYLKYVCLAEICRFLPVLERTLEDPIEIFFDEENVKGKDWRESGGDREGGKC